MKQLTMTKKTLRKILVILSNRYAPSQPVKHIELDCKIDGTVAKEKSLRGQPKDSRFDEVWVNDEGKRSLDDCVRFKRVYRHALEKRKS
jgi:hypothetical protein